MSETASNAVLAGLGFVSGGGNFSGNDTFGFPWHGDYRHEDSLNIGYIVAYLFVFVTGVIGNFLTVSVVYRMPRMRNVTNFFIVNLAIADILVLIVCLPGTLIANIYVPWLLGSYMCKIIPYVQGISVNASVYSLIAVSADRFIAIWWPLKYQITTRRCRWIMVLIWVYAIIIPLPWLFFFKLVQVFPDDTRMFCLEVWPTTIEGNFIGNMYFMIFNVSLGYVVPMIVISMCYILIWIKVWKRTIPTDSRNAHMERIQQNCKVKVIKMLVVVVIMFVVSWLPLYLIFTRIKFGGDLGPREARWLPTLAPIAQFMGIANSSFNPVLYVFFNKKYRNAFRAILRSRSLCSTIHYYDSVNLTNSSSASLRKSSYYTQRNKSLNRQQSQEKQALSCVANGVPITV